MISFEKAIAQAKDALAKARISLGAAYIDLDQDCDWDGQSLDSRLEAQRLMGLLQDTYYAIEEVI